MLVGPRYFCTRVGRGESNQIRCVEISTIEQVEDLSTKLEGKALAQIGRFEGREIPCCQSWTDQGVSAQIAVEAAVGGRGQERFRA